jgi:Lipoate-protein ligase A
MTNSATESWRLIVDSHRSGAMQMALEEVAAETAATGGPWTVRVYSWDSTLSLGYRQDIATVDRAYCDRNEIAVTRRPTGGGGIYHDAYGDISYSVVAPEDAFPSDLMTCYEQLCQPVLAGFEQMGVPAAFAERDHESIHEPSCYLRGINPAHDIVVGERKISGNAQYRQREAVIQHGSLSYALTPERHTGAFAADLSPATFTDRVTAIAAETTLDRTAAVETLASTLGEWADATDGGWTDAELDQARRLAKNKYAADAWVADRTDPTD